MSSYNGKTPDEYECKRSESSNSTVSREEFGSNDRQADALRLNLGAGKNLMGGRGGFSINLDLEEPERKEMPSRSDFVLADATHLPFRKGIFDEVHAINPYGFNPINSSVSSVMTDSASLKVSGDMKRNKYARNSGCDKVDPSTVGLELVSSGGLDREHDIGPMRASDGRLLRIDDHGSKTYAKGKSEPALESDAEREIRQIMALAQMTAREDFYRDEWADADDLHALGYMSDKDWKRLLELRSE